MSDIRETIEDLMYELNLCIDEVNTMRDMYNTDNLTPADHWDKETLHDAQISLRDFVENSAAKLTDRIETHHNNNQSEFARSIGVQQSQITRWLKLDCIVVNGELYRKINKQQKS